MFLNADPRTSPWAELGATPPPRLFLEGWALAQAADWTPLSSAEPIDVILVDIDAVARTMPLDEWALKAWRSTLNDVIARATQPKGGSPLLLGYTRDPQWDTAVVALKVGARDVTRLSRLNERLAELFSGAPAVGPVADADDIPDDASNIVSLKSRHAPAAGAEDHDDLPDLPEIPKHAIPFPIEGLEGQSAGIEGVRNLVRKIAPLDTTVLISGPTGSGKERVARALHRYGARSNGPFVPVACAAIPSELFESELFGHVKGAFTGAVDDRAGLLLSATDGTILLDEVSTLPMDLQVKLLRALQERRVTPVGGSTSKPINARIVTATSHDLDDLVAHGAFREDLLYRLRVLEIPLPSLHERRTDIPVIAKTILAKLAKRAKRPLPTLSEDAVEKCLLHAWPGNIRELENALEHAATLTWGEGRTLIDVDDLPETLRFAAMTTPKSQHLKELVKNFEKEVIASTIRRVGSKESAAESLGLSLATLYRKMG